jgi:drug/metabolite transporter (DMT)-like permease
LILLAVALALGAAGLHATWNVLLKSSGDPLRFSKRAVGSAALLATPLAAAAWFLTGRPGMPPEAWLLALISASVEVAYYVSLSSAYRRGDLSTVYPVARGTAPLLAVGAGVLFLGERLNPPEAAGIACLLLGIWSVQRPAGAGAALRPALLTGVTIATYSAIDRVGVRLTEPWMYGWVLWTATAALLWVPSPPRAPASPLVAAHPPRSERGEKTVSMVEPWGKVLLVGALMTGAYLMVLVALSLAPLSVVAPVRESAIVLVAVWGVWRLKERERRWLRLAGAAAIVAGLAVLAITG